MNVTVPDDDVMTSEPPHVTVGNPRFVAAYRPHLNFVIGGFSLVLNSLVVLVIMLHQPLRRKLCQIFILHQTIIDLFSAATLIASNAASLFPPIMRGLAGDVYCRVIMPRSLVWASYHVSTYNLVVMAAERYLMVVFPIFHRNHVNIRAGKVAMISVWVFGMTFHLSCVIPSSALIGGRCLMFAIWSSPTIHKMYGVGSVIVSYIFPAAILIIFHTHMAVTIWLKIRNNAAVGPIAMATPGVDAGVPTSNVSTPMSKAQYNVTKLLAIVTVSFIVCWTPTQISFFLYNIGVGPYPSSGNLIYLNELMSSSNTFVNPFIYVFQYTEFQKGARMLLRMRTQVPNPNEQSFSATTRVRVATDR